MGDTVRVIEIVSYTLILLIGLRLLWVKGKAFLRALGFGGGSHAHDHTHEHGHGHHHHQHHHHEHEAPSKKTILALGASAGLLPCPSALVVLLAALASHQIPLGIGLILVFSLGLAATLTCLGLLVVYAQRLSARLRVPGRITALVPVLSSLAIVAIGVVMTAKAFPQLP